jgi:hypothetical protein
LQYSFLLIKGLKIGVNVINLVTSRLKKLNKGG